jgi:hypothetical protein
MCDMCDMCGMCDMCEQTWAGQAPGRFPALRDHPLGRLGQAATGRSDTRPGVGLDYPPGYTENHSLSRVMRAKRSHPVGWLLAG